MNDLISRQAAIDAIVRAVDYGPERTIATLSACYQRICDLTPAQQWIPVSERLPESIEGVLVCGREALNNSVIYAVKWYDNGVWRPLSAPSCSWEAWMPLPESFYGNENGK